MTQSLTAHVLVFGALALLASFVNPTRLTAQCAGDAPRRPVEDLFLSDIVYPQEKGEIQLEAVPSATADANGTTTAAGFAWAYGINDARQVDGSAGGLLIRRIPGAPTSVVGADDVSLGSKWSFMCLLGPATHASVSANLEWPTGPSGSSSRDSRVRLAPNFIIADDFAGIDAHLFTSVEIAVPVTARSLAARSSGADGSAWWVRTWNTGLFVPLTSVAERAVTDAALPSSIDGA